ncbi:hypothetical protein EON65_58485 [archaeon]|nr:MAG: hypothetical protein EON65_58485 [archaeon]
MALKLGTVVVTGTSLWFALFVLGCFFVKPEGGWRVPYFWFKIIMFMSTMFSYTFVKARLLPQATLKDLLAMSVVCSVLDVIILYGLMKMDASMLLTILPSYFIGAVFAYTQKLHKN